MEDVLALIHSAEAAAKHCGADLYVIGGIVRDLLSGVESRDYDFCVQGNGLDVARQLHAAIGGKLKIFEPFLTAKISNPNVAGIEEVDVATARSETYVRPGALPTVRFATLADDLKRRDFSINAMALAARDLAAAIAGSLQGDALRRAVLDPFSGISDLGSRTIRVLHDQSFLDDPTRLCRGLRYLVRIDGQFDPHTESLFTAAVDSGALATISPQRIQTEVRKACGEPAWVRLLAAFSHRGLLAPVGLSLGPQMVQELEHAAGAGDVPPQQRFELFAAIALSRRPQQERAALLLKMGVGKRTIGSIEAVLAQRLPAVSDGSA